MHRDFLIETGAVHYSGTKYYGYGIEFGSDTTRQYHFWINASGRYNICYTSGNGFTTPIKFDESKYLVKGDSVKNKLRIEHRGGQLKFFINDQEVESLPEINFSGQLYGVSVNFSQNVGFDHFTFAYLDRPVKKDTFPVPQITILSPVVTRGLKVVQNNQTLHVIGVAKDKTGIQSVKVNEVQASVGMNGNFMVDVPMTIGDNALKVVAVNMEFRQATYTFHVVRNVDLPVADPSVVKPLAGEGKYFALLIGEQDYKDTRINSLEGPLNDANNLKNALVNNYTFPPENITIVANPTREEFFNALDEIRKKVSSEDNILIFYAGHGFYDATYSQGYWFPSDAVQDRRYSWISNSDLISYVTAIKSKHTLLISDACFSGSIFKGRGIDLAPKDIQELYKLPSRKAMTSGNMKEVPDKSVFVEYLVKRLTDNPDKYLSAEQLFARFKSAVINNSPNGQIPRFGEIQEAGDEGGDFIFIRKE